MTVRLLVTSNIADQPPTPGSLLVGAAAAGAVLVLGSVPAAAAQRGGGGDGGDASKALYSLQEMLPHGLSVVGEVVAPGEHASGSTSSPLWVTLDAETRAFCVGKAAAAAAEVLEAPAAPVILLPTTPAFPFALVRATMPECSVERLEQLLGDDGAASPLLFAAAQGGGGPGLVVVSEATTTTLPELPLSSSSPLTTFTPLVDTCPSTTTTTAPVFEYRPPQQQQQQPRQTTNIQLDALAVVPAATQSSSSLARSHLLPALRAQLGLARRALLSGGAPSTARAYHFAPPGLGFPVTMVYPMGLACGVGGASSSSLAEAALAPMRRAAHAALGLAPDRPLLRAANALDLEDLLATTTVPNTTTTSKTATNNKKLVSVHRALPAPPLGTAPTALVHGDYEYCHYLQDGVQDSGWGCAYRSLQTLVSWFRLNGFCAARGGGGNGGSAPHSEAQRTLVQLGDKPSSFAGSNQWIGAVEVGYVLDEWLGVQSRVVTATNGAEVPAKARELARHFREQGTPVMVGGGVLAYTLLGVQYDEATGDAAFLILDPHYTGGDSEERDLRAKIVGGGWVAWKRFGDRAAAGGDLFAPGAFYNFLCPQRPREV
jgi:hypothetical protein